MGIGAGMVKFCRL